MRRCRDIVKEAGLNINVLVHWDRKVFEKDGGRKHGFIFLSFTAWKQEDEMDAWRNLLFISGIVCGIFYRYIYKEFPSWGIGVYGSYFQHCAACLDFF